MVSSELPEVLAMSDRILVMHQGHQAGIFDAKDATQETIMTAATGGQTAAFTADAPPVENVTA